MRPLLAMMLGALVLVGGCSDADRAEPPPPTGDEAEAFRVEQARWVEVCERAAHPDAAAQCATAVADAIDAAVEWNCRVASVEAFLEVAVSRGFESLPEELFFERCPAPLASTAVPALASGYSEVGLPASGVGLLDAEALAATFLDSTAMRTYLDEIGHQVSYARRWEHPDQISVTVRLDRFDEVAGAAHFTAPEPDGTADAADAVVVIGVDDGRITHEAFESDDGREGVRQVAFGRVCDVAVSVVVRSTDGPWADSALEELFVRQVHRVRAVTTC
jgi:hypothetical protein